ncbi:MAG: (Fe-S)-binding protein [Helicobacteraceae bacterium]|jgi:glycolate oxidase iron-sulfur subunit|nr:(Fe-S)-binding protein [Helicobacteraceae bacterium]
MKTKFNFAEYERECVKCAKCVPTCTIHSINRDETTSPRGFIHLMANMQDGSLKLDKNLKKIFESCFLCVNCVSICPSQIQTDLMIENARAEIAAKFGLAWFKRIIFFVLKRRSLQNIAAKFGYLFKSCGFAAAPNGMRSRFALPMTRRGRLLPPIADQSFLNAYPERMDFGGDRTVAIFIGCLANYAYTGVGDSLLYILKALKINAFIPKDQLCCGAPPYFTGDMRTTKWLVKYNVEYFELFIDTIDAILVPEATCSNMIIADWLHVVSDEPEWVKRVRRVVDKTFIASQWLHNNTDLLSVTPSLDQKIASVTYHDPCHAKKTQGVFKEPRAFLEKSYEIKEMSDSSSCCGFGGVTIQSERFALAEAVGKNKAAMIAQTEAEIVSAECSACRMQIGEALNRSGGKQIFMHPLELIAQSLKKVGSNA